MPRRIVLLHILFITAYAYTQDAWYPVNPLPLSALMDVQILNANTVIACGDYGIMLKTTDGGQSWRYIGTGLSNLIVYSLCFVNANTGWATGTMGYDQYIFKTSDGGITWQPQYHMTDTSSPMLYSIYFIDSQTGYAAGNGGVIMRTSNGGTTWESIYVNSPVTFQVIYFINNLTGFVAGDGMVLKTTNGGDTWRAVYNGNWGYIKDMCFADPQHGWLVGANKIMATTDGGETWIDQYETFYYTIELNGIACYDVNHVWAVGGRGLVIFSDDGGADWNEQAPFGSSEDLYAVEFYNANIGWAVGAKQIMKSENGGQTWVSQNSALKDDLMDIQFVTPQLGWAAGYNGLMIKTENGGLSWQQLPTDYPAKLFTAIHFTDADHGWAVGRKDWGFVIARTENGGQTWTEKTSELTLFLWDVFFIDAQTGWTVGENGVVLKTTDGGDTWDQIELNPTATFSRIQFLNANTGWLLCSGFPGQLYRTDDGGATWTPQQIADYNHSFTDFYFVNADKGWAVTNGGEIRITNDGGTTWSQISQYSGDDFIRICFTDPVNGWLMDDAGGIYRLVHGGSKWVRQVTKAAIELKNFCFVDQYTGWAVGNQGCILKTTTGGLTVEDPPWLMSASSVTAKEDSQFTYTSDALHYPGRSVSFTYTNLPAWLAPTETGVAGIPPNWVAQAEFLVESSDGNGSDTMTVHINVEMLNDPPEFSSPAQDTAYYNTLFTYSAQAKDPEGDSLEYFFQNYPNWLIPSASSITGIPSLTDTDTSFTVITTDQFFFDTLQVSVHITDKPTGIATDKSNSTIIPNKFQLYCNYPNPFNQSTTIRFGLPVTARTRIVVYDIQGQEVAALEDQLIPAGYHQRQWQADHVASGVYIIVVTAGDFRGVQKCLLLK
ncbi:MAG TPA: YCF48-related protein [bacterium]|nr:YCF48-related protein [bacterium]HPN45037.1 YCF48-related protein [bacterium]